MTTFSNKDKIIEITFDAHIEKAKVVTEKDMYIVVLPEVKCSSEEDACRILTEINKYILKLSKDLIK